MSLTLEVRYNIIYIIYIYNKEASSSLTRPVSKCMQVVWCTRALNCQRATGNQKEKGF